MYIIFQIIV